MYTNHGVLCKHGLVTVKGGQWDVKPLRITASISWLCEQAYAQELTHLWIMKDTGIVPDHAFIDPGLAEWSLLATYLYRDGAPILEGKRNEAISVSGWKRSSQRKEKQISIIFPHNSKWPFGQTDNPKHLLITIRYLEKILEMRIGGSPATTGWKIIESLNVKHNDWVQPATINLAECHFTPAAARDIIWHGSLPTENLSGKYLHKYDKNSAYLRECYHQMFGTGDPVHFDGKAYDKRFPGVWKIAVKESVLVDLPPALWEKAVWVAAPVVKLLNDTGHRIKVFEGWAYPIVDKKPQYHQWLKPFADLVWDARQSFKNDEMWPNATCRVFAGDSMKRIATHTVGLASYRHFAEDDTSIQRHSEVKIQVVGGSRATMFYNILKIQKDCGLKPVMCYMDALYYISDSPDPALAIPGMLDKKDSLGGYKNDGWTLPLDDYVQDVLRAELELNEKLRLLNAKVRARNGF